MMIGIKNFLSNLISGKYPLGLFFALTTAYIFTPLFLIFNNKAPPSFTISSFSLIVVACAVVLLCSLLLKRLLPKFSGIFDAIMHSFAMYLLVTVIFFPVETGIQDGRDIVISKKQTFLHSGVWAICLLVVLIGFKKQKINRAYRRFTAALGSFALISGVAIAFISLPLHTGSVRKQWQEAARLSKKNNIILICLDAAQRDFAKPYFDNKMAQKQFDGFVFFENVASAAPITHLSLNAVLRGDIPKGSIKKIDPYDTLINDFIGYGYSASVSEVPLWHIDDWRSAYSMKQLKYIPNQGERNIHNDVFALLYISSVRFVPFALPVLRNNPMEFGWTSKTNYRQAYQSMINNVSVDDSIDKKMLWFHTVQTHAPVRFTKEGVYDMSLTPDDVYGEIADALTMTGKFLEKLKQLGVYDDALIVVFADHGFNPMHTMSLSEDLVYLLHQCPAGLDVAWNHIGGYRPLFMVKPPNSTGFKFNDSAVALMDFRKTLNEFMSSGKKNNFHGVNFLNFEKNAKQRNVSALCFASNELTLKDYTSTDHWQIGELTLPIDEIYKNRIEQELQIAISDLSMIKDALEAYHSEHNAYPISQWIDGLYSDWGYSGPDWIKNLVPEYLPYLPRDRRNTEDAKQYLYYSNGKDYKLISYLPPVTSMKLAQQLHPELVDPQRPTWAFGFWTEGAADHK